MAIFGYSIDHAGRVGSRLGDQGAEAGGISEAVANRFIAYGAADEHKRRGRHQAIVFSHGAYSERHGWANRNGLVAYNALHLNASEKRSVGYGVYFYDPQSSPENGARLAQMLADAASGFFSDLFGEEYSVRALAAERPTWVNPLFTIKGLSRPVGICAEPIFVTHRAHRRAFCTPAKLTEYGALTARVHEEWHDSRSLA